MKKLVLSLLLLTGVAAAVVPADAQPYGYGPRHRRPRGCRVWRYRHHHRYCARYWR
ncbi:MAG: hypothetical protein V4734_03670 [Terriglobus sp.]